MPRLSGDDYTTESCHRRPLPLSLVYLRAPRYPVKDVSLSFQLFIFQ